MVFVEIPLGIVPQVRGSDRLVEVATVIVNVTGDPDFAFAGQVDHLILAERAKTVFLGGVVEDFNCVIRTYGHYVNSSLQLS